MNLIQFCVTLAVDPVLFARYLANPAAAAEELGLPERLFLILSSGDRERIARELAEERGEFFNLFLAVHVGTSIWPLF